MTIVLYPQRVAIIIVETEPIKHPMPDTPNNVAMPFVSLNLEICANIIGNGMPRKIEGRRTTRKSSASEFILLEIGIIKNISKRVIRIIARNHRFNTAEVGLKNLVTILPIPLPNRNADRSNVNDFKGLLRFKFSF